MPPLVIPASSAAPSGSRTARTRQAVTISDYMVIRCHITDYGPAHGHDAVSITIGVTKSS
jgi:hypothetical protein